jgi:ATP-dependent Clp protease ATP-binding subunit ClpA
MLTVKTAAWPLRGRDDEMVELVALLRRRRGALLAGPSGVGKTSIAVAVAEEMEPAGWTVVRVVASRPTAGIPLGALAVLPRTGRAPG